MDSALLRTSSLYFTALYLAIMRTEPYDTLYDHRYFPSSTLVEQGHHGECSPWAGLLAPHAALLVSSGVRRPEARDAVGALASSRTPTRDGVLEKLKAACLDWTYYGDSYTHVQPPRPMCLELCARSAFNATNTLLDPLFAMRVAS